MFPTHISLLKFYFFFVIYKNLELFKNYLLYKHFEYKHIREHTREHTREHKDQFEILTVMQYQIVKYQNVKYRIQRDSNTGLCVFFCI